MNKFQIASKASQKGLVLLESLIAVLVFSVGILALAGLQAVMIKNTDDAKYRAEAAFIAQQRLSEIWLNTDNRISLAGYIASVAAPQLPGGTTSVAVDGNRLVTVTVNWTLPGNTDQHAFVANARIEGANDAW